MPMTVNKERSTRASLSRRIGRLAAMAAAVTTASAVIVSAASAQTAWVPQRPIKLIVPFPPGGGADVAARIVTQALGNKLGQPMVVENKAGAGGAIGSELVSNAPPDGYTLLVASADTHSIYPHVYTKARFQAHDFVAVAPITKIAYVLMGRQDIGPKTTSEVVTLAKKGNLSYASWGAGSAAHAAMSMFIGAAGLPNMLHVPYAGAAPAVQALVASQVDLMMVPMPLAVANRSRLTLFGVSAEQRSDALKDAPTLAEQGFPVNAEFWIGVLAPPKTPLAIASSISSRVAEVVADPDVQKQLRVLGMTPHQVTQPQFAEYVSAEYARWGKVIRDAGIKIDE
jgi:tripartite-type tricarboxylate transporter receptor subunit TctC